MRKTKNTPAPVRRAALYIRVSTDEQAKKGYSLPAQEEDLREYAKRNGYAVAGLYIDDGVSARKAYTHRKGLMRLLADVEAGVIDVILFIKLDRWFRNIADYYKIQEILDAHSVAWKTTQENYDTETTNGRLYINIRLSVAQDESDRTGDRIRFVNESKVARGECINGNLPIGFKTERIPGEKAKRVIPDPEKIELVQDIFQQFETHNSIRAAMCYIRDFHSTPISYQSVRQILHNPMYKGQYRNNPDYCQPIIAPARFDKVQQMLAGRSYRTNQTHKIYIFSGLLRCQECGRRLTGKYVLSGNGTEFHYYFCRTAYDKHTCSHHKNTSEVQLEKWLLEHILEKLNEWQATWETEAKRIRKPTIDRAAVLRKLDRLKDLYLNELITMDQYRNDYEQLSGQLNEALTPAPPVPDFAGLRTKVSGDFAKQYRTWEDVDRRMFWREIIKKIEISADNTPQIFFD